ncbi:hypothetical protein Tco_0286134 [Tanacetum coccineum]
MAKSLASHISSNGRSQFGAIKIGASVSLSFNVGKARMAVLGKDECKVVFSRSWVICRDIFEKFPNEKPPGINQHDEKTPNSLSVVDEVIWQWTSILALSTSIPFLEILWPRTMPSLTIKMALFPVMNLSWCLHTLKMWSKRERQNVWKEFPKDLRKVVH